MKSLYTKKLWRYGNTTAHVWDNGTITTPSTHFEQGVMTYKCACGATYTAPIAKLEEHAYTTIVTIDPTCTQQGYTTYSCECGYSYKDNYTAAKGHDYECVECSVCGAEDPDACFVIKVFRYTVKWLTSFGESCAVWVKEAPVSIFYWFIGIFTGDTTIF